MPGLAPGRAASTARRRNRCTIARLRYPSPAIPDELHDVVQEMGTVAGKMVDSAGDVIKTQI